MGLCPPQSYQDVWGAIMVCDINMNEKVSKMEMFVLFKRIQGISIGMVTGQGMGMGMDMNVNMAGW